MAVSRLGENENRTASLGRAAAAPRATAPTRSNARRNAKPPLWWRILRPFALVLRSVALVLFATIFTVISVLLPFILLGLAIIYTDRSFSVPLINLVLNLGPS